MTTPERLAYARNYAKARVAAALARRVCIICDVPRAEGDGGTKHRCRVCADENNADRVTRLREKRAAGKASS